MLGGGGCIHILLLKSLFTLITMAKYLVISISDSHKLDYFLFINLQLYKYLFYKTFSALKPTKLWCLKIFLKIMYDIEFQIKLLFLGSNVSQSLCLALLLKIHLKYTIKFFLLLFDFQRYWNFGRTEAKELWNFLFPTFYSLFLSFVFHSVFEAHVLFYKINLYMLCLFVYVPSRIFYSHVTRCSRSTTK